MLLSVSCRTTSTWTRRRTSWWRTSWLTTKACRTRRATATVSNWIRRLWLRRASQAAANPRPDHVPYPSVLGGLSSGCTARGSPALHCRSQRNSNVFLSRGGVIKAPGSFPLTNGHMTCCLWAPRHVNQSRSLNFSTLAQTLPSTLSHTSNMYIYCLHHVNGASASTQASYTGTVPSPSSQTPLESLNRNHVNT